MDTIEETSIKYTGTCRTDSDPQSKQKNRRLAVGGVYNVCYLGAMPDVCRRNRPVKNEKVVIGAMNPKAGCAGSVLNLLQVPKFNHQVELECGILEEECAAMLREFFAELRRKKKEN